MDPWYEYSVYLNKGYAVTDVNTYHNLPGSTSLLFVNQLEYIEINSSDFDIMVGGVVGPGDIYSVSSIYLPDGLTELSNGKWGGVLNDYTNIQTATFNVVLSDGNNWTIELHIIPVYFPVTNFIMENSISVKINLEYVMQLWNFRYTDQGWINEEVYPRYYFKDGTPEGLSIDEISGEITGSVSNTGTYTICWEIPSFYYGDIQVGSLENYTIDYWGYDDNYPSFIVTTDITISPKINKYSEYILNNKYKYIKQEN
jgi:hypothetical protein